jgi:hypothetical protein
MRHKRRYYNGPVYVRQNGCKTVMTACRNISLSGVCINLREPFCKSKSCFLEFAPVIGGTSILCSGRVVRVDECGCCIRFDKMDSAKNNFFKYFLEEYTVKMI